MEVTCTKCIQPDLDPDLFIKYEDKQLFYDISKINKYYYCVSDANDK
ncbi:hypothetical protein ACFLY2_00755 [Patescibacteria group bacterium]